MGAATFYATARRDACPNGLKETREGGRTVLEQAYGPWPSAEAAMEHLGDQDRHDNGHQSPDGVGGKWDLVHIATVDDSETAHALAGQLIDQDDPRITDKRGPAGCITIRNGDDAYLFFGWVAT